jgi:transcriptional regulator with XRE-family HTH domain
MPTRPRKPAVGRPKGTSTFDAASAKAFGDVVRAARAKAGISQEELAHLSNMDRSYFSKIERGLSQPTLFAIFKISSALGYKAATLIGMTQRAM